MTPEQSRKQDEVGIAMAAMGWTDPEMLEFGRRVIAGEIFDSYGHGGDCPLLGYQIIGLRQVLSGVRAGLKAAEDAANSTMQHVGYVDAGQFHWMSGIAARDCELYAALAKFDHHQANSRKWLADRGVIV